MASIFRKIMRNMRRNGAKRATMGGGAALVGTRRAGMHQAAEHEFQRAHLATDEHHPETPEDALDMPGALEAEIPPVEEDDDEIVEEVAEGEADISGEAEILEEVSDPDAAENEELEDGTASLSVDWSQERIPVMDKPAADPVAPETPLVYDPGDGSLKEIQEPLPGLGEKLGVAPLVDGIENPSANVAAAPEEPAPVEPEESATVEPAAVEPGE